MRKNIIAVLCPRYPFTDQEYEEMLEKNNRICCRLKKNWQRWGKFIIVYHTILNFFRTVVGYPKKEYVHYPNNGFEQCIKENPNYLIDVHWRGRLNGLEMSASIHGGWICQSEYTEDSEQWQEYERLSHELLYVQKLPCDSPEWQAVIEKYRRKDDDEETIADDNVQVNN